MLIHVTEENGRWAELAREPRGPSPVYKIILVTVECDYSSCFIGKVRVDVSKILVTWLLVQTSLQGLLC